MKVDLADPLGPCSMTTLLATPSRTKPTKQRQSAAESLARQCDVVVVLGGAHSNNTRELVATCSRFCSRVFHIQTASDLNDAWFGEGDTVGLTAGTSTPDDLIREVEARLQRLADNTDHRLDLTFASAVPQPVGQPVHAH